MRRRKERSFGQSVALAAMGAVLLATLVVAALLARVGGPLTSSVRTPTGLGSSLRLPAGHRALKVGVVGDSLAYGYYASDPLKAWPAQLRTALQRYGAVSEEVDAGPGETAGEALVRAVPTGDDLVVVELGTNDVRRGLGASFAATYGSLLRRVVQESPRAVLLCLEPWGPQAQAAAYSATIDRLCRAAGGTAVPISGIYSAPGNRANAGVPFFDGTSRDDFHPDDHGHAAIAHLLVSMIHVTR
ncbi:MAG: SGNH/GDSL hydrolase family protein [Actinomycetota bacterium]|nr:SGNH/GDSL hydrolase family protein [Actinomycetota bacterium]